MAEDGGWRPRGRATGYRRGDAGRFAGGGSAKGPVERSAKVAPWLYRLAVRQSSVVPSEARPAAETDRSLRGTAPAGRVRGARESDPLSWLLAEERRGQVRKGHVAVEPSRRGNPHVEIHGRLELSAFCPNTLESVIAPSRHGCTGRSKDYRDELAVIDAVGRTSWTPCAARNAGGSPLTWRERTTFTATASTWP